MEHPKHPETTNLPSVENEKESSSFKEKENPMKTTDELSKKTTTTSTTLDGKSLNENKQQQSRESPAGDSNSKPQSSGLVEDSVSEQSTGVKDSVENSGKSSNSMDNSNNKDEQQQHGGSCSNEDRDPVSNHEESDYEDNIVVTVPSASDTCTDKFLSRRHGGGGVGHPRPPGLDNSPKHRRQVSLEQTPRITLAK